MAPLAESDWRMSSLRPDDSYLWRRSERKGPPELPREASPSDEDDLVVEEDEFRDEIAEEAGNDEPEAAVESPRVWRWLTMMGLTYVALVLIEHQIHPAVPAVMLCFKLCFGDVLNALWLARRDPDPQRGKIVALWYLTRAMWHVGAWAFFLMILIYLVTGVDQLGNPGMGPGPNKVDVHTIGKALIATFGVMFAGALAMTIVVVVWATLAKQPVWLGKGVTRWRTRDRFPPFVGHPVTVPNDASSLVTVVTITAGMLAAGGTLWCFVTLRTLVWRELVGLPFLQALLVLLTTFAPLVALIGTMVKGATWVRPTIALTPEDCWTRETAAGE